MSEELISVIVPVYNVEKYLDRCIKSIINQSYKNIEILLIDDGSPDNCPKLCDEWAKKDERIKVFHKVNAGLGMARNTGIDYATGKYICFVDSDDYIDLNLIQETYDVAKQQKSDIVMYGLNSVDINGNIIKADIPLVEKNYFEGSEILEYVLPNMIAADPETGKRMNLNMSASGSLFSKALIDRAQWRFVSERQYISEDFYSLLDLYEYVQRVSILNAAYYYYCYNDASLTHVYNAKKYKKICECHSAMLTLCEKKNYPREVKVCLDSQFIGSVIAHMKQIILIDSVFAEKKKELRKIIEDEYIQLVVKYMNTKNESLQRKILINVLRKKRSVLLFCLLKIKTK